MVGGQRVVLRGARRVRRAPPPQPSTLFAYISAYNGDKLLDLAGLLTDNSARSNTRRRDWARLYSKPAR